jgi:zinc D-Ala-D-Ala carboxypeptidase
VAAQNRSKHFEDAASDIATANHVPEGFKAAARAITFFGVGFYPRSGFIRVDLTPVAAGRTLPVQEDISNIGFAI